MLNPENLRLYCFALLRPVPLGQPLEPLPPRAQFMLGYSMDDVMNAVDNKYGTHVGVHVQFINDIPFEELLRQVEQKPEIILKEPTPEMKMETFINNLKLVSDKFLEGADRKSLSEILKKVKVEVKKL